MGTQVPDKLLLLSIARDRDHSETESVRILDGQMAQASEPLDSDRGPGVDVHLPHRIEDGHSGAENGSILGGANVSGDTDTCLGAQDTVFGIYNKQSAALLSYFPRLFSSEC